MNIRLRRLTVDDVSERYVKWMNDPEVGRYLETRFERYDLQKVRKFVEAMSSGASNYLFGIFVDGNHVGNIKVGPVNDKHGYADISLLIGEKSMWGRGVGTEAVRMATEFAFFERKLRKTVAGMYASNIGSFRAFMNNGYREVGRWKEHRLGDDGKFVDQISLEKMRP